VRTIRDSAVFSKGQTIDMARKIKWLNDSGYRYTINFAKGVDHEDVVVILWEEEFEDEAEEGEPLD
jgi:hypothetical protein